MKITMKAALKQKLRSVKAQVLGEYDKIRKADDEESEIERILKGIKIDWSDVAQEVDPLLVQMARDGVKAAADQLNVDIGVSTDLANKRAEKWAHERAAELVGMKWVDGELVDNPNPAWSIADSTRDMIRSDVATAIEEGWSNDKLAAALEENYAFSPERAETIARTETAAADVQGNVEAYQAAQEMGIRLMKKWITADDDKVSDECRENGEQEPIPMDDEFSSGAMWPPQHPNCRCDILPLVEDQDE